MDTGEFTPAAPRVREALGVEGYDPYAIGSIATQILPFAAAGRTAVSAPTAARQLEAMFPNLGRETGAYVAGETGAAAAREIAPDSMLAEIGASLVAGTGASMALGPPPTAQMVDSTERTYQHRPTSMNPFVGRLDRFIGTELEGTTTLPALVNRLRGKFRGYDIQRVEEIAKGVDPSAKFKPNEILDMLRVNYDPSAFQVQQRTVNVDRGDSFYTQDDPFRGEPNFALERSVIMLNRDNLPQGNFSSEDAEYARKAAEKLELFSQIGNSDQGDLSNLLEVGTINRMTAPLVEFLGRNRGADFDNEIMPVIDALYTDVKSHQEKKEVVDMFARDFSPAVFFRNPSFSSALKQSKQRQEAEGGKTPTEILKTAELEAFKSTYNSLMEAYKVNPDVSQLFRGIDNIQDMESNKTIVPFLTNIAVPEVQQRLQLEGRDVENSIRNYLYVISNNTKLKNALQASSTGLMPGSNPLYQGRHQSLTPGVSNLISLSRTTDVKADIPGMGNNVKGIYLHELQSDLVNDIRRAGGPQNMSQEQLRKRLEEISAYRDALETKRDEARSRRDEMDSPDYEAPEGETHSTQWRKLSDEIDDLTDKIVAQKRPQRSITARLSGLPPSSGVLADEPFVGASESPGVLQQLMIKAAVKAAMDRGLNFVALTSPQKSREPQLYERTPQNAKDVVKDLGEGFVLQKLKISSPSGQTGFSTMGIVWDQQDAAGREALNRIYTKGVPFKDGGEVSSAKDMLDRLTSAR
jgi:hypothetical protein